jgi:hypothetical protein
MLIPIVGPMVMFGYLIRRYAKVSGGKEVEDFDSNFFGDYLKIGLRPVLAVLVMLLVAMPFIFVAMLPMMFAPAFEQENEGLMIGLTLFSYPVSPRTGLMTDFKAGFSKEFVFSFVKKSRLRSYRLLYPHGTDFLPPHDRRVSRAHHRVYVVALILRVAIVHLLSQHYDIYPGGGGNNCRASRCHSQTRRTTSTDGLFDRNVTSNRRYRLSCHRIRRLGSSSAFRVIFRCFTPFHEPTLVSIVFSEILFLHRKFGITGTIPDFDAVCDFTHCSVYRPTRKGQHVLHRSRLK